MALNDIVMARIVCTLGNQTAFTVRHYKSTIYAGALDTRQALATALDTGLAATWKNAMSNEATYRGVMVKRIFPLPPTVDSFTIASAGLGAVVGTALPKQTSGVVSLRTANAGRAFRGRAYIPFPSEVDNIANGLPQAAYNTALVNIGIALLLTKSVVNGPTSETWTPVLYHRLSNTTDPLTAAIARNFWATQRRRGDFGAQNLSPI
jgi:hypothetical protein